MTHDELTEIAEVAEPPLAAFLTEFLGGWPATRGLTVVGSPVRTRPGWDGVIRDVVGVAGPEQTVLSVRPDRAEAVRAAVRAIDDLAGALPAALGQPGAMVFFGKFRWTMAPSDAPDVGEWIAATDPRVPAWLRPFGGEVLITFIDGAYAAGVGVKRHNAAGWELSVGTEEAHRGRGLATRLVAQAARRVIAAGAVPIYLHDPANVASDRTATTAGFPDRGWQIIGVATPSMDDRTR